MGISPGNIASVMPPQFDDTARKQRDLERQTRENAAARSLAASEIGNGGTLIIDGALQVNGTITTPGTLSSAGNVTAGGSVTAATSLNGSTLAIISDATIGGNLSGINTLTSASLSTGGITGSSCNVSGDFTGANVRLGSSGTLYSTYALSNTVVTGYVAAYINGPDGRFGATPSARRFKRDIKPRTYTVEDAKRLSSLIVDYRLKAAVKEMGDTAPIEVGVIAERLIQAGFPEFVIHDKHGRTLSVAYERIWLVTASAFGDLAERVERIERILEGTP